MVTWYSFPRVKWSGRRAEHTCALVPRLGIAGAEPPVLNMLLWPEQRQLYVSQTQQFSIPCTVIPRLTKTIRSGITFVSRNLRSFL